MNASDVVTVVSVRKGAGIAGQVSYTATVSYPGEGESVVTFTGSVYGGPVVMATAGNPRGTFVTGPSRFGAFGESWVRRFFGEVTK